MNGPKREKAIARMLPELEKLLMEDFGDGKWHRISELQRHVPPEMADAVGVRTGWSSDMSIRGKRHAAGVQTETSGKDLCDETHPGAILLVNAAIDDLDVKRLCRVITASCTMS